MVCLTVGLFCKSYFKHDILFGCYCNPGFTGNGFNCLGLSQFGCARRLIRHEHSIVIVCVCVLPSVLHDMMRARYKAQILHH